MSSVSSDASSLALYNERGIFVDVDHPNGKAIPYRLFNAAQNSMARNLDMIGQNATPVFHRKRIHELVEETLRECSDKAMVNTKDHRQMAPSDSRSHRVLDDMPRSMEGNSKDPGTKTSSKTRRRSQSTHGRKKRSQMTGGDQKHFHNRSASHDRKPTVFELFNMDRHSQSETRETTAELYRNGLITYPKSVAHQERAPSTFPRKNENGEGFSLTDDDYEEFTQCPVCNNRMERRALQNHIRQRHGGAVQQQQKKNLEQKEVGNYVRCKICTSMMHIDYMATHILRKHKTNGSIGIISANYNDDQINKLIEEGRVFVKDGLLYAQQ